MATGTLQKQALQAIGLFDLFLILDSATQCHMTFRDNLGCKVLIPVEGEGRNGIPFDESYESRYPVKNWRVFLKAHLEAGRPTTMRTNKDVLMIEPQGTDLRSKHRRTVFEFAIPGLNIVLQDFNDF
jgi:hypothetical protein